MVAGEASKRFDGDAETAEQDATKYRLPKKLIICCDGTWQDSDNGWVPGKWGKAGHLANPTNVTRIARAIRSEDDHHHPQIVYYQAGVGTGLGLYDRLLGGGTGLGLADNIREAYVFLASNYSEHDELVPNDSIFLVGFSRGAYTARSLGGFVCAMGILRKIAMPHFYEVFEDWERAGDPKHDPLFFKSFFKDPADAKKYAPPEDLAKDKHRRDDYIEMYFGKLLELNLTQKVEIKCIGVWDTVGSLGIPVNPILTQLLPFLPSYIRTYSWFDTRLNPPINNAFQALAMDEHRFPFSPAVWEQKPEDKAKNPKQVLKQVWFPGVHSNIGGSYPDSGIADLTLAWMLDQLSGNSLEDRTGFQHHDWIQFDDEWFERWVSKELPHLERRPSDPFSGWGKGYLYQSDTFPESLLGMRVRSPGQYHATHYETGRTDWSTSLVNTNEHIHSCVRARVDLAGRDVEADPAGVFPRGMNIYPFLQRIWRGITGQPPKPYQPHMRGGPLSGWRLLDGHQDHRQPNMNIDTHPNGVKEIAWVNDKKEVLPEAKLCDFEQSYERRVLERDKQIASQIEFTNQGWRWFKHPLVNQRQHNRTF